jgi:hypothetical protein
MYFTGFADEAGDSIDVQIRATQELGWSHIEARSVDSVNLTDILDEAFDRVCEKLAAAYPSSRTWRWSTTTARLSRPMRCATTTMWSMADALCGSRGCEREQANWMIALKGMRTA